MNTSTNNGHRISSEIMPNTPRPAAFLQVKHVIMQCKTQIDINEANKMINRYIFNVCEKPLRQDHMEDLLIILDWKIEDLGLPSRQIPAENEADNFGHRNCGFKQSLHPDAENTDYQ